MKKKSDNGSRKNDSEMEIPPMTRAEMRRGVLGKYASDDISPQRIIQLDKDVAKSFRDNQAVNDALRLVLKLEELVNGKRKKSA